MARHIWINPDRIPKTRRQTRIDGVDLVVQLSPYDAPTSISGQYDQSTGCFVIQFMYVDNEPPASRVHQIGEISIREGRYSGKILTIRIPVDRNELAMISMQTKLMSALKSRKEGFRGVPTIGKELNQEIAEEILSEDLDELASELVGAT